MPQKIENIDPNFRPQANTAEDGFCFRPLWEWENVVIDGLFPGTFCRIDPAALPRIPSEGVRTLAWHTAGGTVRFRVPGGRFFVRMELRYGSDMSHMPRSGSGGLDVYCGSGFGRTFCAALRPASSGPELVAGEIRLPAGEEEALLHLPLYDGVKNLELGFPEGGNAAAANPLPGGGAGRLLRLLHHPGRLRQPARQRLPGHDLPDARLQLPQSRVFRQCEGGAGDGGLHRGAADVRLCLRL